MKRLLLFIVVSVLAIGASAQKLNSRGEKMVAKLEIEEYNYGGNIHNPVYAVIRTTYKFGYNNTRLVSVDAWTQHEVLERENNHFGDLEETKYNLHKNVLTRKDYHNGIQNKPGEWKYIFDGDIITKAEYYDYSIDGSGECLRDDNNFYYTTTDKGYPRMSRSLKEWYVRMAGTKHFVKGDSYESGIMQVYRYRDGDPDMTQLSTPQSEIDLTDFDENYQYTDTINDTNINWLVFTVPFVQWGGFDSVLTMTEWVPCKSEHLPIGHKRKKIKYSYIFDCGNLVRVEISYGKRLDSTINVTYVEE